MKNTYTFISLFSGAGGFKIGFEKAGFKCLLSSDIEPTSEKTHFKNFKNQPFLLKDIRTIKTSEILKLTNFIKPDLIIGGPRAKVFLLWVIKILLIQEMSFLNRM